jgi:hypothetical protein
MRCLLQKLTDMEPIRIPDAIFELLVQLFAQLKQGEAIFLSRASQTAHDSIKRPSFWASPVNTSAACLIKVASFTIGIGSSADAFACGQNGWF